MLSGHTHVYTITRPTKGVTNFPVIVGGGPYSDSTKGKTTYTLVEINKNILTATLKKANGEVIDKVAIKSLNLK